ncbi:MAG: ADP-ribosylation factor-like protein [Candidatus Heimdallarchaeaceae archaeon]
MASDIRKKLLKESYQKETNLEQLPLIALLDMREEEYKELTTHNLKTVSDLAENWREKYDVIIKKFPKDRVNSWITASRLLLAESKGRITTGAKIILCGIDNAGKTSLSIALKHRGALSLLIQRLYALTPTRGLLRSKLEVFGMEIYLHELGGQKIYREDYLSNPEQYFIGTDIIIYVLDVQARDRLEENFEYLKQIVQVTKALKLSIPWKIFFHKSDPDYQIDDESANVFASMIKYVEENIPQFSASKDIFRTSVKIRSSILGAFSHIFREIALIQDQITEASKKVAQSLEADYFGLYDFRSNICFAQYSASEDLTQLAHSAYYEAIETVVNMREPFLRIRKYTINGDNTEVFLLRDVKFGGEKYIMALLTPNEIVARNLDQDEIEEAIEEHLKEWIEFRNYARFPIS